MAIIAEPYGLNYSLHTYKDQEEATRQLRYTEAAREYWLLFKRDGNPERACEYLRDNLDSFERNDPDFKHILHKLSPYDR